MENSMSNTFTEASTTSMEASNTSTQETQTLRALNRKPMAYNVQSTFRSTLRGTYAGDQYDARGRQRGTLILCMGPTGAINGTPIVDNVRSRNTSNSLKASLAESTAQRKPCENKYAKMQERR